MFGRPNRDCRWWRCLFSRCLHLACLKCSRSWRSPRACTRFEETAVAESSLAPVANVADPTRAEPLLAGFSLNFAAVDAALKELVGEVETLSDELVDWFDEAKLSPWSLAAGVAVAAAGGYYLRRRRRSLQAGMGDEEPASWLFLNLQLPRAEL